MAGEGQQWGSKGHVLEEEPLEAIHRRQRNDLVPGSIQLLSLGNNTVNNCL